MPSFIDDLEKSTKALSENLKGYFAQKDAQDRDAAFKKRLTEVKQPPIVGRENVPINNAPAPQMPPVSMESQPRQIPQTIQSNVSSIPAGSANDGANIMNQAYAKFQNQNDAPAVSRMPTDPAVGVPSTPQPTYGEPLSDIEALRQVLSENPEMIKSPLAMQTLDTQRMFSSLGDEAQRRRLTDEQIKNYESEREARLHPKPTYLTVYKDGQPMQIPAGAPMPTGAVMEDVYKAQIAAGSRNPDWKPGLNPKTNKNEYYDVVKKQWTGVQVGNSTIAADMGTPDEHPGVIGIDYLKTLPTGRQSLVKAIGEGRKLIGDAVGNRGNQKMVLNEQVNRAYPAYDEGWVKASYRLKGDAATGNIGKSARSINTAIGHLAQFDAAARALNNVDITGYNSLANWVAKNTGDPRVLALNETASALSSELATTFKGGASGAAGTEAEIKDWRNNFADNLSKAQFDAAVNTTLKLMGSRIGALQDQYNNVPYHDPNFEVISPKAQQVLNDYGFKLETTKPKSTQGGKAVTESDIDKMSAEELKKFLEGK